ncbi:MAG: DUF6597 domain-containing transcriptional factor [Pseudorhizobium sp.]
MNEEAILANAVRTYIETAPVSSLRTSFRCAWINYLPDKIGVVTVTPDGCIDLVWRGNRFSVVGPDIGPARPNLQSGGTVVGIRFRPGVATNWLGLPISEIVGQEVDMQDVWGGRAIEIAESLHDAGSAQRQLMELQKQLSGFAPSINSSSSFGAAMFNFVQKNAVNGARVGTHRLAEVIASSERSLRRRSQELFGYGPKLHRILRLQELTVSARMLVP